MRLFLWKTGAIQFEQDPESGGRTVYKYCYVFERLEDLLTNRSFKIAGVEITTVNDVFSPHNVTDWLIAVGLEPEISETSRISRAKRHVSQNGLAKRQDGLAIRSVSDHIDHKEIHKNLDHTRTFSENENAIEDLETITDKEQTQDQEHGDEELAF